MRHLNCSAILSALLVLAAAPAFANGIDTGVGTTDLPFNIEGSQVMNITARGLAINATATDGTACGNVPNTNPAVPVAIGTLAQDGTGKYLSCQSTDNGVTRIWESAFGSNGHAPGIMSGWGGTNWPDAIKCTDNTTAVYGNPPPVIYVFLVSYSLNNQNIQYLHANWSQNAYTFKQDGSPYNKTMFSSDGFSVPTDCDNKTIQELIANGQGFFMYTSAMAQ